MSPLIRLTQAYTGKPETTQSVYISMFHLMRVEAEGPFTRLQLTDGSFVLVMESVDAVVKMVGEQS